MGLKILNLIQNKESKLVMTVNVDVIGGKYENGWLYADSKSFGSFNYKYDSIAPIITFSSSKKKTSTSSKYISFKVSDNLSGIADYNIYVNDVWQIAEYDAKSNTISCYFNEPQTIGTIKIEVVDRVGNKATVNKEL